jgi:hypothetical protein
MVAELPNDGERAAKGELVRARDQAGHLLEGAVAQFARGLWLARIAKSPGE